MHEIPEVLMFVCLLLLLTFSTVTTWGRRVATVAAYYVSAVVATVIGWGVLHVLHGAMIATGVLVVWALALGWATSQSEPDSSKT